MNRPTGILCEETISPLKQSRPLGIGAQGDEGNSYSEANEVQTLPLTTQPWLSISAGEEAGSHGAEWDVQALSVLFCCLKNEGNPVL